MLVAPVIPPVTVRPPIMNASVIFNVVPVMGPDTSRLVVTTRAAGITPFVSSTPLDQTSPPVIGPETSKELAPVIPPVTNKF